MTELNISPAEFTLEAYQGSIIAIIELFDATEEKVEQTKIALNANPNMNLEVSIVNQNGIITKNIKVSKDLKTPVEVLSVKQKEDFVKTKRLNVNLGLMTKYATTIAPTTTTSSPKIESNIEDVVTNSEVPANNVFKAIASEALNTINNVVSNNTINKLMNNTTTTLPPTTTTLPPTTTTLPPTTTTKAPQINTILNDMPEMNNSSNLAHVNDLGKVLNNKIGINNNVITNNNNVVSFSENQVYEVENVLPEGLYMNYYPLHELNHKSTQETLKKMEKKLGTHYNVKPYDAKALGKSCE